MQVLIIDIGDIISPRMDRAYIVPLYVFGAESVCAVNFKVNLGSRAFDEIEKYGRFEEKPPLFAITTKSTYNNFACLHRLVSRINNKFSSLGILPMIYQTI